MARDTEGALGKKKEKERDAKAEKVEKKEQPGISFLICVTVLFIKSFSFA